jgi:hypothetical protein
MNDFDDFEDYDYDYDAYERDRDTWDALTDGQYGPYPGRDVVLTPTHYS